MFKDNKNVDEISREKVEKKMPSVLKVFEKRRKDDLSGRLSSSLIPREISRYSTRGCYASASILEVASESNRFDLFRVFCCIKH